jgi:hypothetical protein
MAERSSNSDAQGGGPLFKDMDTQERIYAPEAVPDANLPAHEVDADGSTAGAGEPPDAAPIAAPGNAPSAAMAPAGQVEVAGGKEVADSPDPLEPGHRTGS